MHEAKSDSVFLTAALASLPLCEQGSGAQEEEESGQAQPEVGLKTQQA